MNDWPTRLKVDPLGQWPGPLTSRRQPAAFKADMASTLTLLEREIRALGGRDVRLQIAIAPDAFRFDGYPRATAKPEHPGIILTLQSKHGPLSYPCDTFTTWQDNLRAIALALEALRKVDRYGVTKRGEQYRGFLALEATTAQAGFATAEAAIEHIAKTAYDQFNLPDVDLRTAVRTAKRIAHPDMPYGSADAFQRVSMAEAKLLQEGLL